MRIKRKRDNDFAAFRAVTWNVFYGTPLPKLRRVAKRLIKKGVTVFLIQEGSKPGLVDMLRDCGLHVYRHRPEFIVAWVPDRWERVEAHGVQLGSSYFFRPGSPRPVYAHAARVLLRERATGRLLDALSYHLPSHTQVKHAPARRFRTLTVAMEALGDMAARSAADAILFGGDDNVDERKRFGPWSFMLHRATGLRQVRAPKPTHKGGRRIDDFRTRGLWRGEGEVGDGGGDHKYHIHTFRWKKGPKRPSARR